MRLKIIQIFDTGKIIFLPSHIYNNARKDVHMSLLPAQTLINTLDHLNVNKHGLQV